MRSAEEIIDEDNDLDMPSDGWETTYTFKDVVKLINTAREEAIEECAKVATVEMVQVSENDFKYTTHVDKQSILNLIKELK